MSLRTCAALLFAAVLLASSTGRADTGAPAIQPWPENPFYWQFQGRPVLLVGGSDDDNLFQWPDEDLREQLDALKAVGGNYVRNTMSDRADRGWEVRAYMRRPDGRYDLDTWNPEYWRRFDRFLQWTAERGIIVQIEIWDRFDHSRQYWTDNPYNPANTHAYTAEASGLATEYPRHPNDNEQPFFFTTPAQRNNQVLLKYQRRFVERMLDSTLRHGHVLYCIDNETSGEEAWATYWTEFVKTRATARGRRAYVTEMWDAWDVKAAEHRRTLDHPERYDFVDVSQNNHNSGRTHWANAIWVREYVAKPPRPINTVKTYGADGNRFKHTDQDGVERLVRHVLAGFAAVRFHRPESGLGLGPKARAAIEGVRRLEALVPAWTLTPHPPVQDNGAGGDVYVASGEGVKVFYFPDGGSVDAGLESGSYETSWIGLDPGAPSPPVTPAGPVTRLTAPPEGNWLGVVRRAGH